MFHFAVCCCENKYIKMIGNYLQELWQEDYAVEMVPFTQVTDLLFAYKSGEHFDLIILDKDTQEVINRELINKIYKYAPNANIIILTNKEHLAQSRNTYIYRYILKPIDKELFLTEISVLLARLEREDNVYYKFANVKGLNKVKLSDVYYFESNLRSIRIYEKGNEYIFTGKISDIENTLAKQDFVRNHKSYVVNLKYVRNIYKDTIILENNEKIPLSKHRSKKMRKRVFNYMQASKR